MRRSATMAYQKLPVGFIWSRLTGRELQLNVMQSDRGTLLELAETMCGSYSWTIASVDI